MMNDGSQFGIDTFFAERMNYWYWEDIARLHERVCAEISKAVPAGDSTLRHLELEAVENPSGKEMLHLMCHLGHDLISWSWLGARVVAVDASEAALRFAMRLSDSCRQAVEFRRISVPDYLIDWVGRFDVIVMTYGVLSWIADIDALARGCAACLATGGILVVVDDHPLASFVRPQKAGNAWKFTPPAATEFSGPRRYRTVGSYLRRDAIIPSPTHYRWHHAVDKVVTALVSAGLRVERQSEYNFTHYPRFPDLRRRPDGYYEPVHPTPVPLLIELKARKPIESLIKS